MTTEQIHLRQLLDAGASRKELEAAAVAAGVDLAPFKELNKAAFEDALRLHLQDLLAASAGTPPAEAPSAGEGAPPPAAELPAAAAPEVGREVLAHELFAIERGKVADGARLLELAKAAGLELGDELRGASAEELAMGLRVAVIGELAQVQANARQRRKRASEAATAELRYLSGEIRADAPEWSIVLDLLVELGPEEGALRLRRAKAEAAAAAAAPPAGGESGIVLGGPPAASAPAEVIVIPNSGAGKSDGQTIAVVR